MSYMTMMVYDRSRRGDEEHEERRREDYNAPYSNTIPIDAYRHKIGFGESRYQPRYEDGRFKRRSEMEDTMRPYDLYGGGETKPVQFGGTISMNDGTSPRLTREMAEEWVNSLENDDEDRPKGGVFTMEKAKELAKKVGFKTEGQRFIDFYAINEDYIGIVSARIAERYAAEEAKMFEEMLSTMSRELMPETEIDLEPMKKTGE
jgi:hypothetical protein